MTRQIVKMRVRGSEVVEVMERYRVGGSEWRDGSGFKYCGINKRIFLIPEAV